MAHGGLVDGASEGASLMERRWLNQIEQALHPHGITIISYTTGGKHSKIVITNGIKTRFIVTAITPSDRKVLLNIVQSAKRTLSEAEVNRR